MDFVDRPKVFPGDGIYLSENSMSLLRYGIWIPLFVNEEKRQYIIEYVKKYYPEAWEEEVKSFFKSA